MKSIIFIAVLFIAIFQMNKVKKGIPDGQIVNNPLTRTEKSIVWVLCMLNPVFSGAVFYYGWKSKLPLKAKSANNIAIISFFIWLIVYVLLFSVILKTGLPF